MWNPISRRADGSSSGSPEDRSRNGELPRSTAGSGRSSPRARPRRCHPRGLTAGVQHAAARAGDHPLLEKGGRLGYTASGVPYLVLAWVTVRLARTSGGERAEREVLGNSTSIDIRIHSAPRRK